MRGFVIATIVFRVFAIGLCLSFATAGTQSNGIQSICRQPKVIGQCDDPQSRWWYDPASGNCNEFVYNGCAGNLNNFLRREDCEKTCEGVVPCRGLEVIPYGCMVTELDDGPDGCPDFKIDCSNYPGRFPKPQKDQSPSLAAVASSGGEAADVAEKEGTED